ncbi:MAG: hypothetical protein QGD96_12605, partial [Anaerolineae bacterium]|nr:hypothetical protein [Anaerolineae bacterium]
EIIFAGADLSLGLIASTQIPAGVVLPFSSTATINNLDLLDAQNTTLQITLPDGISYLSDDSDVTPTQAGGTLTWDLGTLSAGESTSLTLQAKSNLSLTVGSSLTTTAVVSTSDVEDDLENNSASADTPVVSGYSSSGSIDPANQTLAIGGSGTFDLTIHNTGLLSDQYGIAVLGLEAELYSLSQTELALAPQENVAIALNTTANSCEQAGTHAFTAVVTSQSSGASFTLPGSVEFLSAPIISNLRPANGTIYGSRDVSISWQTDVASNGSLTVTPEGQPENAQTFETSSGNSHTVLVTDLDRNSTYSWVVTATSPCGETTSNPKQFSIGNGVVFKDHQTNLTIDRDYDQTAQIMVTNQDNKPHDILVEIQHSYEDLIVNFRGSGSIDETITLLPGESRTIELAVFAQDAELIDENYVLNAVLTSSDGLQTITDLAIINVRVLFEVNYSLDEISSNSLYNTTTYRITNYGQPITDLFVNVVDPTTNLPASVMITPQVVHARLGTDESLEFTATPLYSVEDLTDTTGNSSTIGVLASLAKQSGAIDINFAFDITVANVVQRHEVQQSCDLGRSIYAVTLSNVLLHLPFKSWYCPNRANIHMGICVPPIAQASNITGASININIDPTRKPSKYDFSIRVNGHQVGALENQIPEGQYRFPIDKSFINTAFSGCASNDIHINARFDNYAHYQIWADGELSLALDSVTVFVCAIDQAQADQIAFGLYNFEKLPDTFSVDIRLPNANSTAESNSDGYVKLQAFVSDNLTSFKDYYTVEAEIEYLDAIGTPTEKFLLFNDGLAVHADPTAKDRSFNTLWLPKYGGDIHMTVYATGPAGRVVTDEITFNIDARPDFELTRVFIEKITRKGQAAEVLAEIINNGFPVTGPITVEFRYYAVGADGQKVGDPIYVSQLQIFDSIFNSTFDHGELITVKDKSFEPPEMKPYFVEAIVDPE